MEYPESCIKGIPNLDFVIMGQVAPTLFAFQENRVRVDNFIEESINWNDDDLAIGFTLSQTKEDGTFQFKFGVAILPLIKIDELRNRPSFIDILTYERQPLQGNRYHGNILVKSRIHTHQKRLICAGLALSSQIIQRVE